MLVSSISDCVAVLMKVIVQEIINYFENDILMLHCIDFDCLKGNKQYLSSHVLTFDLLF